MSIDELTSRRIAAIRYAMMLGLVSLHMPPYESLEQLGSSGFDLLKGFLSHGLFRATTPMLTAIAGYLLFTARLDLAPPQLLRRKSQTLLLPLLAWNVPLVLALFLMQSAHPSLDSFRVDLQDADLRTWLNAVLGWSEAPVNYPLFFLRDLFVLCLLAPQLGMLLRTAPWWGAAVVAAVSLFNLDGPLIMRDTMLINFYMGGMAAVLVTRMSAADRLGPYCLAALLGYSLAIPLFDLGDRTVFSIVAPLLIWPAASLFMDTRVAHWLVRNAKASFFTFLVHAPMLVVAWAAYRGLFGDAFDELAWLVLPVLVSITCLQLYRRVSRLRPVMALLGSARS